MRAINSIAVGARFPQRYRKLGVRAMGGGGGAQILEGASDRKRANVLPPLSLLPLAALLYAYILVPILTH